MEAGKGRDQILAVASKEAPRGAQGECSALGLVTSSLMGSWTLLQELRDKGHSVLPTPAQHRPAQSHF